MAKATQIGYTGTRTLEVAQQIVIVIAASLSVAVCARLSVPIPFTPVPLTLQNFAVLVVGLTLGSRLGFAALLLYLVEGASGLPVFTPGGLGGVAQLHGATGGFLIAYPFMAGITGLISERGRLSFTKAAFAGIAGEIVLFSAGIAWLAVLTHSVAQAFRFGLYWFVFAEILKVVAAASIANGWQRFYKH